ncbi:hypothetical protein CEY09_30445 [Achromobacter marplatensis]|uniref:Uncharacterized protein n=1 Tax=Achromobacter marplatensis TaxID=470868 RepID=A0ABX9FVD9_9BURK|nr:hypothetical protein [Achromobacter marplatensis]OWT55310.1 hypothetical protein CEY09_30445 [Achromobacter marplatensis]RBP10652.1 hypothetical protein DFP87_12515 [Achromobacter marplatensis]CAB3712993.1 hypothetical protein LMG26219_06036 [Achromobacter marplatensis]
MARGGARPGAGRKPGIPNRVTADIKALAQNYGEEAIDTLASIMRNVDTPPQARVAAAKELIERGYGKASQPIGGADDLPPIKVAAVELTDDQLASIAASSSR